MEGKYQDFKEKIEQRDYKKCIEHVNERGESLLMYSISLKKLDLATLILEHGGNINFINLSDGCNILHYLLHLSTKKEDKVLNMFFANFITLMNLNVLNKVKKN